MSPSINYVRDLIAEGYIGKPLSGTLFVNAANWGATLDRAYQADFANGANLMTITGGHNLDALCYCLGEFRELSAFAVSQRDRILLEDTGEMIAKDVPDQLVVSGIVGDGTVVSAQVRGGMKRGQEFLFEIHGTEGDLSLAATMRASTQRQELTVRGARGSDKDVAEHARCRRSIAGCRRVCRKARRTTLRNCTQSSARPFATASLPIPASTPRSPATGCST